MEREQSQKQKWGESLLSHYLAENIDRVMLFRDFHSRQIASELFTNIMISSLCTHNIPPQIFEHVKIDFTHRKLDEELPKYEDSDLQRVESVLISEFGTEVMRRVNLSISEEKVHSLTHQDCI